MKQPPEVLYKEGVLKKTSQNSHENTFSCEFCEISKNTFFIDRLWTTASGNIKNLLFTGRGSNEKKRKSKQ